MGDAGSEGFRGVSDVAKVSCASLVSCPGGRERERRRCGCGYRRRSGSVRDAPARLGELTHPTALATACAKPAPGGPRGGAVPARLVPERSYFTQRTWMLVVPVEAASVEVPSLKLTTQKSSAIEGTYADEVQK